MIADDPLSPYSALFTKLLFWDVEGHLREKGGWQSSERNVDEPTLTISHGTAERSLPSIPSVGKELPK